MITEEMARRHLQALHKEGSSLVEEFAAEQRSRPKLHRKQVTKGAVNVIIRRFSVRGDEEPEEAEAEEVPEPVPADNTRFGGRYPFSEGNGVWS